MTCEVLMKRSRTNFKNFIILSSPFSPYSRHRAGDSNKILGVTLSHKSGFSADVDDIVVGLYAFWHITGDRKTPSRFIKLLRPVYQQIRLKFGCGLKKIGRCGMKIRPPW